MRHEGNGGSMGKKEQSAGSQAPGWKGFPNPGFFQPQPWNLPSPGLTPEQGPKGPRMRACSLRAWPLRDMQG